MKRRPGIPTFPGVSGASATPPRRDWPACSFSSWREKAAKGDSFVVLGRCSGYILREFPGLISLFVRGDLADRVASIQQAHHLTQDEALEFIRKGDKRRAAYHNEHCPTQWGHGDTYDLTINSSRLGLSGTTDFLEDYIRRRIAAEP